MIKLCRILLLLLIAQSASAHIKAVSLTCEDLTDPMAVGSKQPRLSWVNVADEGERNQRQTAYQIQVASSRKRLLQGNADLWDSGQMKSDESTLPFQLQIGWQSGLALTRKHRCSVKTSL